MDMVRALELLSGYTAGQWGLVTTRQALPLGVDDVTLHRLKAAGLLETVRHGVHAMTSSVASEARPEQAAWLSLRPEMAAWERPKLDHDGGVISHQSAARLHGLGDLPNTRVEMTVPRRRTMRDPGVWLRKAKLTEPEVTVLDGLPVTTPVRTIQDLLDRNTDSSHIATIIRQAVEAGQVRIDQLPEQISPFARRYGARPGDGTELLTQLLAQIGLSIHELATRHSGIAWGQLSGIGWADLENANVTWGQLATVAPELAQRFLRDPAERKSTPEPNDGT
ncbi:type IV toxin-antitoxin system AbiEi family antitoxin domain-containing protein [Amycolatopsis cihanbeyliensis]|uniref:Putative transcriptional regulator of viral defense system n=1 Tax=Amycolatopsis cihanbeyliensis TaxID=1128664 RepID=A0A542DGS5_AMYCI|nr:type IV toxin-antitoxin system AbiEi family antitoxin domain-containing protein [Amycolatopsis cihanbeyliensis]TQJ02285.1 putative transcriptional regulator of viral defense system [Amycolatopsis cihanbeyliensis]